MELSARPCNTPIEGDRMSAEIDPNIRDRQVFRSRRDAINCLRAPRDGRSAESQLRSPRHADGHGRHRRGAVAPVICATIRPIRPGSIAIASCCRRSRLDAALRVAASHRLRPADGGAEALPPAALEDAGTSRVRHARPASRRPPARSARGLRMPSAWRSRRSCSPRSSIAPASTSSITAPTYSSATAA